MARIKSGKRKFSGKSYDFWMFAKTKKEAENKVKVGYKHFLRFDEKAYFRITRGATTHSGSYAIWVRLTTLKE